MPILDSLKKVASRLAAAVAAVVVAGLAKANVPISIDQVQPFIELIVFGLMLSVYGIVHTWIDSKLVPWFKKKFPALFPTTEQEDAVTQ